MKCNRRLSICAGQRDERGGGEEGGDAMRHGEN
jgi:hypothetical protein